MSKQITDTILMVRPANFGYNPETAVNNAFQFRNATLSSREVADKARVEFDGLVNKLRSVGIEVLVIEDTEVPLKKDAVFPNNWFTTHMNGSIITYPMFAPIRRMERREDIIEGLMQRFHYHNRIYLEGYEADNRFLEGTGSMILDRANKLAYACRSVRTDEGLLDEFCGMFNAGKVIFDATDKSGAAIYHTNVMMAMGETFCVICLDTIQDEEQRARIIDQLKTGGREIINISFEQMASFAGNMLQLKAKDGQAYLVMSEQAFTSLTKKQIKQLTVHTRLLYSPIDTIETSGGGSVRCMIAEIFYSKK